MITQKYEHIKKYVDTRRELKAMNCVGKSDVSMAHSSKILLERAFKCDIEYHRSRISEAKRQWATRITPDGRKVLHPCWQMFEIEIIEPNKQPENESKNL